MQGRDCGLAPEDVARVLLVVLLAPIMLFQRYQNRELEAARR